MNSVKVTELEFELELGKSKVKTLNSIKNRSLACSDPWCNIYDVTCFGPVLLTRQGDFKLDKTNFQQQF